MDSLTIREIIEQVEYGQIRIPAFQRGFVWEPERVAQFIDSLYKGYPFGALLFWRTNEKLKIERSLGPFTLPEPKADFPIDYVLDGQQRITSAYATFQSSTDIPSDSGWKEIYFDFTMPAEVQEPQFFALTADDVDPKKHFPLSVLFDTVAYRKATKDFGDSLAEIIDAMQARFKEARLPYQTFRTEDKGTVAVIFERINRQGVPLDTLQLLSAWTWSEDFQLQSQFEDLVEELESKGFEATLLDENLLLRCTAAILVADPRPEAIVRLTGEQIRTRFDEVVNGVMGALDFLEMNFGLRRVDNLPYQTILVPLSVFFATSGAKQIVVTKSQRDALVRWLWRVSFSKRYSSGVIRHLEDDIKSMLQLKGGQQSTLGSFNVSIEPEFFLTNEFGIRNVNTKTFVMMLAQNKPLSFVSGAPVDLNTKLKEYNNTEFHHMVPRAFLKNLQKIDYPISALANHCFLSRSENKHLGGVAPSAYKQKMAANYDGILRSALAPESLFSDDYNVFARERAKRLAEYANKLVS
ncbi:DUF262 domain-containing protein [Rudaea sp.]|uniref:GmrSD restriction endonuclease domain-containing protein n=1 Tax=Rudaea sp. TaxID=2136325 RepID=UPI00321FC6E9